ncbi:MAG: DivIVA domain-containing protein [Clostridia bacterium]|nr:DivIVA domain-containing protein [Clostridia bacterium]
MDITSLKGTAFGGYSKKSVHEFFEELTLANSIKLSELAEEKGALIDKITELEKKVASLEEALGNSENDKEHVAKAIVSAEKEAAKILANAASEAEELKKNTQKELKGEFELLKDLRLSTLQAMTAYKDKLDAISKRLGGEE